MRVLLISPLPNLDPPCGDVTYTETLIAYPPDGVEYETYAEALARGTLREHGTGKALKAALRARTGIFHELLLTIVSKIINFLRKKRLLFWEPFRFFSVQPGEYNAIHLHVFSVRFFNLPCPLIVSNAAPQRFLYTQARKYSQRRTALLEAIDCGLARLLKINLNSYYLPQTRRLIAFSEFLKTWYVSHEIIRGEKIDVTPIFLPSVPMHTVAAVPRRVGFIAKDFRAKGGHTLLRAFEQVRAIQPEAELLIVGCPPQIEKVEATSRGITWLSYVSRETLIREILPSFDVFAYPTEFDGLPLVILEAMSYGIPLAISDYQAMPEIVAEGRAGLVSPVGNADALAANILQLLEPCTNAHYSRAAWNHFEATYSATSVRPRLRASYEAAVADR